MKVAVIGAGLSGLASAWELVQNEDCRVTVFDAVGIGGGASGVASGLMHPYVGEQARRSESATEGMQASRELLKLAEKAVGSSLARYDGIVRIALTQEQEESLEKHVIDYGDVEALGNRAFWICSGVTVHCRPYLNALWKLIESRGGKFIQKRVETIELLSEFDRVVIAAGYGISQFEECRGFKLKFIKGQVLSARAPVEFPPLERSLIGKGYLAVGESSGEYHLGSSYEREFTSTEPCLEKAKELILAKIGSFFPEVQQLAITGCRSGVRVMRSDHYLPILQKLSSRCWVITALGSRGLLYHALLAKQLASPSFFE